MLAEFAINNKIHSTTKVSPFMVKYRRELRKGVDIRRKRKMEKVMEFVKRIKKVQEEAGVVLKRMQEEMKQQADRERNMAEEKDFSRGKLSGKYTVKILYE